MPIIVYALSRSAVPIIPKGQMYARDYHCRHLLPYCYHFTARQCSLGGTRANLLVMLVNEMEQAHITLHVVQDCLEDSLQGKWLLALSAFLTTVEREKLIEL